MIFRMGKRGHTSKHGGGRLGLGPYDVGPVEVLTEPVDDRIDWHVVAGMSIEGETNNGPNGWQRLQFHGLPFYPQFMSAGPVCGYLIVTCTGDNSYSLNRIELSGSMATMIPS